MKQFEISFTTRADANKKITQLKKSIESIPHSDITFYLTWTEKSINDLSFVSKKLNSLFPKATYYGNESSGGIYKGKMTTNICLTCTVFENKDSKVEFLWVEENTEVSSLSELWKLCKAKENLRGVELIPSLEYLDILKIDGNVPNLGKDVMIFGGASVTYTLPAPAANILLKGHSIATKGMVVALYLGNDLHFSQTRILGWKGLGRLMTVTKSQGKIINEIEGEPAYTIYEKYLNLQTQDRDTIVFPIMVEEQGVEYIRTPQFVYTDKSIQMLVEIPVGSQIHISYGDKNTILSNIIDEANKIAKFKPQAIKAYSCAARRIFWGDAEISKETEIIQKVAPVCGYYSGGEIYKFGNKIRVLNQTLTLICAREGEGNDIDLSTLENESFDKSLVSRLAYFTSTVSKEQEDAKNKLLEDEKLLKQNMGIIGGLASEYLALYYLDLNANSFRVYSVDAIRLHDTKKLLQKSTNPFLLIKQFAQSDAVHPDDRAQFKCMTKAGVRERLRNTKKFTIRFRRNYGNGYLWSVMDVLKYEDLHEEANIIAIGFAERDSEIKAEQEQKASLENALNLAQTASKAKTTFLFNMSHDIRTPLNAIIGYTNIAAREINNPRKALDSIKKANNASDMLLSLINDILDMSRIEAGKVEVKNEIADAYRVFKKIEPVMRNLASPKDINLTFEIENIIDRYCYVDTTFINRILINIVSNAIKYTPANGRVEVVARQIDSYDGIANFEIVVKDNGIGMSKEFQEHMFEEFAREENSTTSGVQGTGLGLPLAQKLVQYLGGNITCESEQGVGSTFTIYIPLEVVEETKIYEIREKEEVKIVNLKNKKILYVEDNELNLEIGLDILQFEGCIVETATNGRDAIELIKAKGPDYYDMVLMDIQMPIMNGYVATQKIRELYPNENIPIVAISANAFEEDKAASLRAGMNGHVAKPIDVKELKQVMSKFVK